MFIYTKHKYNFFKTSFKFSFEQFFYDQKILGKNNLKIYSSWLIRTIRMHKRVFTEKDSQLCLSQHIIDHAENPIKKQQPGRW